MVLSYGLSEIEYIKCLIQSVQRKSSIDIVYYNVKGC